MEKAPPKNVYAQLVVDGQRLNYLCNYQPTGQPGLRASAVIIAIANCCYSPLDLNLNSTTQ